MSGCPGKTVVSVIALVLAILRACSLNWSIWRDIFMVSLALGVTLLVLPTPTYQNNTLPQPQPHNTNEPK